jgi:hypothetical protein
MGLKIVFHSYYKAINIKYIDFECEMNILLDSIRLYLV